MKNLLERIIDQLRHENATLRADVRGLTAEREEWKRAYEEASKAPCSHYGHSIYNCPTLRTI